MEPAALLTRATQKKRGQFGRAYLAFGNRELLQLRRIARPVVHVLFVVRIKPERGARALAVGIVRVIRSGRPEIGGDYERADGGERLHATYDGRRNAPMHDAVEADVAIGQCVVAPVVLAAPRRVRANDDGRSVRSSGAEA